jgi:hypothetical protein
MCLFVLEGSEEPPGENECVRIDSSDGGGSELGKMMKDMVASRQEQG